MNRDRTGRVERKRIRYLLLTVLTSLLLLPSAHAVAGVVARVGDAEITDSDLQIELSRHVPQGHIAVDSSRMNEYRKAALNDLIERELLSREATRMGIAISEEEVAKILQKNIERFGSEEELNRVLEQNGLTMEAFKERIRKDGRAEAVLKRLAEESAYSEEELKAYYEEHRAKYEKPGAVYLYHILVKVEPSAPEEEWQKRRQFAEELLQKLKSGEDFGAVAYQYSDDAYRFKSGEIGYVHRGRLTPQELEDAAFSLKKGEISGVIRTIYGFHILKAGDKKPPETLPFDEVRAKIKGDLEGKRFGERKEEMLGRLRKTYPVLILEDSKKP